MKKPTVAAAENAATDETTAAVEGSCSTALYYTPLRTEEIGVMIAVGFKSTREGGTEEKIQFPRKRVRLLRTRLRDSNTRPGRLLARGLAGLG
jgi:hypothetical protein